MPSVTRFTVVPGESRLFVEARSTLHPIHGEAEGLTGRAEAGVTDGRFDLKKPPKGRLELPVAAFRSGNALRDFEMARRVEARKFPTITAELVSAAARNGSGTFRLEADLTFHGLTRRLAVDAVARLDGKGRAVLESSFTLDVRTFDVKPPRLMGLAVDPEVTIRVKLVLEKDRVSG